MKWLEEALSKVELTDEAKATITSGVKAGIGVNFVPKDDFNAKNVAFKELEAKYSTDIAERDSQITELGKTAGDNEAFKTKVAELEALNTQTKETFEQEKADLISKNAEDRKRSAVQRTIDGWNPQDGASDLLMTQVDLSKISEVDGKFIGMDDILNPIKEKFAYTLGSKEVVPGGTPPNPNVPPIKPGAVNLDELKTKAQGGNMQDRLAYMEAKRATEGGQE